MNYRPPHHPAAQRALPLLRKIRQDLQARQALLARLDLHPETTAEHMAQAHAHARTFHARARDDWQAIAEILARHGLRLCSYDQAHDNTVPLIQ
jgi:hypothetical protein